MILETRSLQLVLAIAEHGTMTQAARQMHLTQSALSHHLLQLEARLRLPLFHRMGRRMLPTRAGLRVVELARRVLPELTQAEEELSAEAAGRRALIRLSTECYTSYHWLPRVIAPFQHQHPDVEVRIVSDATDAPLDALLASELDLALVHSDASVAGVCMLPLFTDELVLVSAPDHPLAVRGYVTADDLGSEHLIACAVSEKAAAGVRTMLAGAGVMPRRLSTVPLTEAIVEMVKADLGVSILSRWAVTPHVDAGTVAAVRLGRDGSYRQWKAAMLQDHAPRHLRHFVRLLARGPVVAREDAVPA